MMKMDVLKCYLLKIAKCYLLKIAHAKSIYFHRYSVVKYKVWPSSTSYRHCLFIWCTLKANLVILEQKNADFNLQIDVRCVMLCAVGTASSCGGAHVTVM